jgi:hypothetical protein
MEDRLDAFKSSAMLTDRFNNVSFVLGAERLVGFVTASASIDYFLLSYAKILDWLCNKPGCFAVSTA